MIDRSDVPAIDFARRRELVTHAVDALEVDALLLTDLTDIRWLTGFTGSNGWIVVRDDALILGTDLRYRERAAAETAASGADIVARQQRGELHAAMIAALSGAASVGLDAASTSHATWTDTAAELPLSAVASPVKQLRRTKDQAEIARIAAAAGATDAALAEVEPALWSAVDSPVTEADIRDELEYRMRRHGADDRSYATIVASGPEHAARPHHEPTRRTLAAGDTVIIDVGALVDGYHSDMTRSWVIGDATGEQVEVYELVRAAQLAGLAATRDGVTAQSVDRACRDVFDDAGRLDWYLHGTGHGVGLEIHEPPFHSPSSSEVLTSGMVVTVEPGLYRDGFGGFRIEDLVVVTDTGHRTLTHSPVRPLT